MFEYLVIFMIVIIACWFVGRNLWHQIRDCHCGDCCFAKHEKRTGKLVQLETISKRKPLPGHRAPMIHDT